MGLNELPGYGGAGDYGLFNVKYEKTLRANSGNLQVSTLYA
jgi:hypothetical protein